MRKGSFLIKALESMVEGKRKRIPNAREYKMW